MPGVVEWRYFLKLCMIMACRLCHERVISVERSWRHDAWTLIPFLLGIDVRHECRGRGAPS